MDTLDELLKGPDSVKSDQLTGPILQSTPLLGRDIWQEAIDYFDVFADCEANANLSLEQQQYTTDLRVDHYLYVTLKNEFDLLDVWLRNNHGHPEDRASRSVPATPGTNSVHRSWIDRQEKLYLWAQGMGVTISPLRSSDGDFSVRS